MKYRCYSPTALTSAYKAVKEEKFSVRRASIQYGVPMQTLRDRVLGKIDPESISSGTKPLFSLEEEAVFVEHLKAMASLGYGYTGAEVVDMASNYAIYLGKRTKDKPLTEKWYRLLKRRWPDLCMVSPRALGKDRAYSASEDTIHTYFSNLGRTLTKHNLVDKPQNIYNIDEKGVQTEHRPPKVVAGSESVPGITSPRSSVTTIIGCGYAVGTQLLPYFIFKGQRMQAELLEGCSTGAAGTVIETGWSNASAFLKYLNEHFLQYIQRSSPDEPVLLILDGHRSHVNLPVLEWAKQQHVIILVLPAHTSHILQPLDVGCFGPLQRIYNAECHKFLRLSPGTRITKYNVAQLACNAYTPALSVKNLRSSFEKTGIYPFNQSKITQQQLVPSLPYIPGQPSTPEVSTSNLASFFDPMNNVITQKQNFEAQRVSRKTISTIVSGNCVTSPTIEAKIKEHCNQGSSSSLKEKKKSKPCQVQTLKGKKQHWQQDASPNQVHQKQPQSVLQSLIFQMMTVKNAVFATK